MLLDWTRSMFQRSSCPANFLHYFVPDPLGPADKATVLAQFLVSYLANRDTLKQLFEDFTGKSRPEEITKQTTQDLEMRKVFKKTKQGR
jgi:hypothetical protein